MEIIDLYLFNNKKELIDIISDGSLIDNTQEQHLNGLITHTVSGVYTDSVEDADYFGLHDIDDNGVFWRYRIDTKNKRDGKFTLDGTYELFDDLKGKKIITDLRPYNYTAVRALTALLEDTGWQVGNVSSSKVGSSNWYYINTLSAFWDFLENWGVEFKPRMVSSQGKVIGRYIDIADRISDDYGKWYEYGSDLLTVEAETDLTNIATAYYGRGKGEEVSSAEDNESGQAGYGRKITFADIVWSKANGKPVNKPLGQEFVELPELTELYGFEDGTPRYDVVEFSDIDDKEELLQATYDYAIENARPKVQFKSTVNETDIAELGEVVTIIRDDLNIRYKTRIFKIKRSFFNNKIKDFEFGDELIISQAKSTKQAQKAVQKQIDEANTFWLTALREAITDSFWNEDGYNYDLRVDNEYGLPSGYYSFDRPIDQNPTKAIYMGAGKLLIANSKDPNGEWIWETALDGDGIMADKIVGYNSEFVLSNWNMNDSNVYIDGDGVKTTGANGDIGIMNNRGEFRSQSASDSNLYALMGGGRFQAWGDRGSAFQLGADLKNNTVYDFDGGLGISYNNIFSIGRYDDWSANSSLDGRGGSLIPYLSIMYDGNFNAQNDRGQGEPNGYIRIHKPVTIEKSIYMGGNNITQPYEISFYHGGRIYALSSTSDLRIQSANNISLRTGGDVEKMRIDSSRVYFYQDINMQGNGILEQSDERLKGNFVDATTRDSLGKFKRLNFTYFEWLNESKKRPQGTQFGVKAQEVMEIAPEWVKLDADGYYTINVSKMQMESFKAIQQLENKNEKLQNEVAELTNELSELKELLKEKGVI